MEQCGKTNEMPGYLVTELEDLGADLSQLEELLMAIACSAHRLADVCPGYREESSIH